MIVKSMTRKNASFSQLSKYMEYWEGRDDAKYRVIHNTYASDRLSLSEEFESNAQLLKSRKNGVFLYHEIVSIKKIDWINEEDQKKALCHIVNKYIDERSPGNLVYWVLHCEKKHIHYHLMISANELDKSNRLRLTKWKFADIKKNLKQWALEKYPTLDLGNSPEKKQSQASIELRRRTGKNQEKEFVVWVMTELLTKAQTELGLKASLEKYGFQIYQNWKTPGILVQGTGRKYRFKTIGLLGEYEKVQLKFQRLEAEKTLVEGRRIKASIVLKSHRLQLTNTISQIENLKVNIADMVSFITKHNPKPQVIQAKKHLSQRRSFNQKNNLKHKQWGFKTNNIRWR